MQEQKCAQCEKKFKDYASNHRRFCSRGCQYLSFEKSYIHICEWCSKDFIDKKKYSKFCSLSCAGKRNARLVKNHRGGAKLERHWNWKGGGTINTQGYREIPLGKKDKKVLEHRLVMEKHIGRRLLRSEHVHHINGDKTDNRIENLIVLSPSEHQKIHNLRRWHGIIAFV